MCSALLCQKNLMCLTRLISYRADIILILADFILKLVLYGQNLGL